MPAPPTDRATHIRALAALAAGGRFGNDQHAQSLGKQAEACERGETLLPPYHWLHATTLVASVRHAVSSPVLTVDYLRALWIALGADPRGLLRGELEPLAHAFKHSHAPRDRARAAAAIAAWAKTREFEIGAAFAAPFRDLT